jgi:glutamine synthetase
MMLRAKEGSIVKVRYVFSNIAYNNNSNNSFIPALVIQIDGSMMQIEYSNTKQRIWLYRGSPLLDQMNTYYSTENKAAMNGFTRHTARQHLSARRTNVPEIICLNDQTTIANKGKSVRTAEQALDDTS